MAERRRRHHIPNIRRMLESPGAIRVHLVLRHLRLLRDSMLSPDRRRRAGGTEDEELPVARALTFQGDESPSTSKSRPIMPVNRVDYQQEHHVQNTSDSNPENSQARQNSDYAIVNRLLLKTRTSFSVDERTLQCLNCGKLPLMPVTGSCGHTRCFECTSKDVVCYCGISHAPWPLNVNVLVQEITQKVLSAEKNLRQWMPAYDKEGSSRTPPNSPATPNRPGRDLPDFFSDIGLARDDIELDEEAPNAADNSTIEEEENELCRNLITPQVRLRYACHLIQSGRLLEAGLHLARLAATASAPASSVVQCARQWLLQIISELSETEDVSVFEKEMSDAISAQATTEWLNTKDLQCVFCCDTLSNPVTTPCGHTFCRNCLERSLDYRDTCPLCMHVLNNFNLQEVCITESVRVVLEGIGAVKPSEQWDPNLIPILACSVTFPGMPCPLLLLEPRYHYMVRRILDSESRRFGLVSHERRRGMLSDYGTILELRDSIQLQNGVTIVATIGISRFKVVERQVFDGWCDVARVNPVVDLPMESYEMVDALRTMARLISYKSALWLSYFSNDMRHKMLRTFGAMPYIDVDGDWWQTPDGPVWLWWIISALPLTVEFKVILLSTDCLYKRMRAVLRTLDYALAHKRSSLYKYHITLREWWERRHL